MVLAPGKRTVSAALRVMGLGAAHDFALYHYVLNRARWNSRAVARTLLTMILDRFLSAGPVVIGHRRHDRRPAGSAQDRRSWRLSRPSAFLAWSFRQDERLALALGDGHGSRSMDAATLGLALPDYSGALRTLQHRTQTPSQKADGIGLAKPFSRFGDGCRSARSVVADSGFAGARSDRRGSSSCLPHHEVAARRQSVRAGARTPPRPERTSPRAKGRRLPKLSFRTPRRKEAPDQAVDALPVW